MTCYLQERLGLILTVLSPETCTVKQNSCNERGSRWYFLAKRPPLRMTYLWILL